MPAPRLSLFFACLLFTLLAPAAGAQVTTEPLAYTHDGVELQGHVARPAGAAEGEQLPGVLLIHEWWGLNDYAKSRASQIAELGYVVLAADMYGDGQTTDDPQQAGAWAGPFYQDRAAGRARAQAALDALKQLPGVDADRVAVLGYCFGGTMALELAYAAPEGLRAAISFHGNPLSPMEGDAPEASILILHGAADPMVSRDDVREVTQALSEKDADWALVEYADALHSFTNPEADDRGMDGIGYDEKADQRSWAHMKALLEEALAE